MSTLLLSEGVPGIDTEPVSFSSGGGGVGSLSGLKFDSLRYIN